MARLGVSWKNDDGAVAPLVGLSLFALIAAGGIAFDYARIASLDTEMQNAADQAALAAAAQLDNLAVDVSTGEVGSTARADAAAKLLLQNLTLLGNDGNASGRTIEIVETVFYRTKQQAVLDNGTACPATDITDTSLTDTDAGFVCVRTTVRTGNFALTPVVAAMSGSTSAMAVAGIDRAICNTPPLMICNPAPGQPFTDSADIGDGVRVTGHGNTKECTGKDKDTLVDTDGDGIGDTPCDQTVQAWAPGDFGFLEVGDGSNAALKKALAFQYLDYNCTTDDGQRVNTGNPQGLYDAINTRFGIYDFSKGSNPLGVCRNDDGDCPAAPNSVHDLSNTTLTKSGNAQKCGLSNSNAGNGFFFETADAYSPAVSTSLDFTGDPPITNKTGAVPARMGYTRDLCHYANYGADCPGTYPKKLGDGNWARGDYFAKYHPSVTKVPANITRYETYLWEQGVEIYGTTPPTGFPQSGSIPTAFSNNRACSKGTVAAGIDRRVLTVAIVENCSALSGSSTNAIISDYVDMFLVEPVYDNGQGRGDGDIKDSIYMEFIGVAPSGANGLQTVVKEVPVIIK